MNQLSLNYFVRISIIQIILPDHNIIKLEIKDENITENLSCIWKLTHTHANLLNKSHLKELKGSWKTPMTDYSKNITSKTCGMQLR